ncbi:MAG: hypothetical protein U0547_06015 [Dehalococcoidia bacterium]
MLALHHLFFLELGAFRTLRERRVVLALQLVFFGGTLREGGVVLAHQLVFFGDTLGERGVVLAHQLVFLGDALGEGGVVLALQLVFFGDALRERGVVFALQLLFLELGPSERWAIMRATCWLPSWRCMRRSGWPGAGASAARVLRRAAARWASDTNWGSTMAVPPGRGPGSVAAPGWPCVIVTRSRDHVGRRNPT